MTGNPPAGTEARRDAILEKLADFLLAEGVTAASLRPMARAAGTSDRMLLYYFRDKADVIAATLERIVERLTAALDAMAAPEPLPLQALQARLGAVMLDPAFRPFARLWLDIVARASRGDPVYRQAGERIGRGFLAWGAAQLDSPTPEARERDAARLLTLVEGAVLLSGVGMEDVARGALAD